MGIFSLWQYSHSARFPRSARLMKTPMGMRRVLTISTASSRSFSPKGLFSVTRRQKSLPRTPSMTGQEVPGEQSKITVRFRSISSFSFRMIGVGIGSPTFKIPWTKERPL